MDFWLAVMFEDNSQLLDIARTAEGLGFAGIAVADHIAVPHGFASVHPSGENPFDHRTNFPDPLTTIAAMAAVTTRLRFMPYVYILPMRNPFSIAKQAGTVAMLSDYRFVLGVGAGWLREEILLLDHAPRRRGKRMDEMIEVIRGFWQGGVTEFHGECGWRGRRGITRGGNSGGQRRRGCTAQPEDVVRCHAHSGVRGELRQRNGHHRRRITSASLADVWRTQFRTERHVGQ